MNPLPAGQHEPVLPVQPTPSITAPDEAGDPGIAVTPQPVSGPGPWERRQPQVDRRSVLPVEWFRRMPGGGTTYAPADAEPADVEPVADGA